MALFPLQHCKTSFCPPHSLHGLYSIDLVLIVLSCLGSRTPMQIYWMREVGEACLQCRSSSYAAQVKQYDDDVEAAIRAAWCASAALHILDVCAAALCCSQPASDQVGAAGVLVPALVRWRRLTCAGGSCAATTGQSAARMWLCLTLMRRHSPTERSGCSARHL